MGYCKGLGALERSCRRVICPNILNGMVALSKSLAEFAVLHSPDHLFGSLEDAGLSTKRTHSENVIRIVQDLVATNIFQFEGLDFDLLAVVASLHDIGRATQYDLIGSYDDIKCDHQVLASQLIWRYLRKNSVEITGDWKVLLDVCQYHGRPSLWTFANEASLPYLQIVSAADSIENGCVSAPGYLEREKTEDSKGYIKRNPDLDQMSCSEEIICHLENGESFDKYALCDTYAGYFIFAGTLAAVACRKYGTVAKTAMEKSGSLEAYLRIYRLHLDRDLSNRACQALLKYCH